MPFAGASSPDQIRVFEYSLYNIKIYVRSPLEAYPNQSITVNITATASAKLIVNCTAIELYTLNSSTKRDEKFAHIEYINYSNPLSFSGGQSWSETSYNSVIPESALSVVYGKLILVWTETGTDESTAYTREPTFIITSLKNPELERLRMENEELKKNITDINDTLTEALNNLTDIKNRYEGEIGNTRSVATLLAVTTVFFVATTVYLVMRKPKEYF
jgi:hypothetical protein